MTDYRLYLRGGAEGRIVGVIELDCPDDETAVELAERRRTGVRAELWQRARKIRAFEPSQPIRP